MLVLLIAGVASHFQALSFANTLMIIAFAGLAGVFFLNAYRPPTAPTDGQDNRRDFPALLMQTILPKILWISSAVGAAALVLVHQQAPEAGYKQMFLIQGSVAVIGLLLVGLAAVQGRNVQNLIPVLYRVIPITLAGGHFLGYY